MERSGGGEKKKYSGRNKPRLLIVWKTSKAKSHFCPLLLTFPVISFFFFGESKRGKSQKIFRPLKPSGVGKTLWRDEKSKDFK